MSNPSAPREQADGFVHLHARSWYSFLRGASSPEALVERAAALGQEAVAVTDFMSVAGAVKLQQAARRAGIRSVTGSEVLLDGELLVLLAAGNEGYATLCRLLTVAYTRASSEARRAAPIPGAAEALVRPEGNVLLNELADDHTGLILLTGGREGRLRRLIDEQKFDSALAWARQLSGLMPGRVFLEASSHERPGEGRAAARVLELARAARLPGVASNDVRYATPDEYTRHDLLTCVRLGLTVHDQHPERPVNDRACLVPGSVMRERIFDPAARANTLALARECDLDLLPGGITPPGAIIPDGLTAAEHLETLCRHGLPSRYPAGRLRAALAQLEHELDVINNLDLADFFLVVHEVVDFARSRGIRCAGRGSAANSIVAYLLGITTVDPIEHHLLFERFLHAERRGTPDIDVDFDTSRRDEVVDWMERRFGADHTAMTANVNTYRGRSAVRDTAKALGWSLEVIDDLSRALPHSVSCRRIPEARAALEAVVGPSPLLDVLITAASDLQGCPRHLSLHSGGMLLTRRELWRHTPVRESANGVKQAVFDKEDVEAMGLVKLDVLGLRSLATISCALALHETATGDLPPVDDVDLNDPLVYDLICSGETLALFQVESPGQMSLIARHQPRTFQDLIAQIALLRPGPLQGGMVNPYVRRSRGDEPVTFPHESLRRALKDTFGIILYQEQVLEVAHDFAGLSYEESDEFRRLMSKWRDPGEMNGMKDRFIEGARRAHPDVTPEAAETIFFQISQFVGYGFPRSHAAAFARTVYQTAWLKAYYPAAYLAAIMEHHPGMYPRQSFVLEAQRCGVSVLPASLERSSARWTLETAQARQVLPQSQEAAKARQVLSQGQEAAKARQVLSQGQDATRGLASASARGFSVGVSQAATSGREGRRWRRGFAGQREGLAIRTPLSAVAGVGLPDADTLLLERAARPFTSPEDLYRRARVTRDVLWALAEAGALSSFGPRRDVLWQLGVLERRLGAPGLDVPALLDASSLSPLDLAELPALTLLEETEWDLRRVGATTGPHPIARLRPELTAAGVQPIERITPGRVAAVAGLVIARQRPPTAKGIVFITLEDETGRLQCITHPPVWEAHQKELRAGALILRGEVRREGAWRGLIVHAGWPLTASGGQDGDPHA